MKLLPLTSSPPLLLRSKTQWETQGVLLSDFGFGPWRAESEALVASLRPSYQLKQLRVAGENVRVLKAHPGLWQVRPMLCCTQVLGQCSFFTQGDIWDTQRILCI